MSILLNPNLKVSVGRPFIYVPQFDNAALLQGLNCGDDGTLEYAGLPAGFTYNQANGQLTGTFQAAGTYLVTIQTLGMDSGCSNQQIYEEFDLHVEVSKAYFWSKNPITTSVATDNVGRKVQLELHVESQYMAGDFSRVLLQQLTAGPDKVCQFRYDTALDAFLEELREKDVPAPAAAQVLEYGHTIRRFFVRFAQVDDAGELGAFTQLEDRCVMLGGVAYHDFPEDETLVLQGESARALDSRPALLVTPQVPVYFTVAAAVGARLKAIYTFIDEASGASRNVNRFLPVTLEAGVFCVPLTNWPLATELDTFTFRLLDEDTDFEIYGPIQITLNRDYVPQQRVFLIRNSKGGFETLACQGVGTGRLDVDRQTAQRNIVPGYSAGTPTRFTVGRQAEYRMKVATGWHPNAEYTKWLAQELMLSSLVYELVGGKWLPVQVITKGLEYFEDERYLTSFSFEYTYGFPALAPSTL